MSRREARLSGKVSTEARGGMGTTDVGDKGKKIARDEHGKDVFVAPECEINPQKLHGFP